MKRLFSIILTLCIALCACGATIAYADGLNQLAYPVEELAAGLIRQPQSSDGQKPVETPEPETEETDYSIPLEVYPVPEGFKDGIIDIFHYSEVNGTKYIIFDFKVKDWKAKDTSEVKANVRKTVSVLNEDLQCVDQYFVFYYDSAEFVTENYDAICKWIVSRSDTNELGKKGAEFAQLGNTVVAKMGEKLIAKYTADESAYYIKKLNGAFGSEEEEYKTSENNLDALCRAIYMGWNGTEPEDATMSRDYEQFPFPIIEVVEKLFAAPAEEVAEGPAA